MIPAVSEPDVENNDGVLGIIANIGTGEPLRCFIYDTPLVDVGAVLSSSLASVSKTLDVLQREGPVVSVARHAPVVSYRFLVANKQRPAAKAIVDMAVHTSTVGSSLCIWGGSGTVPVFEKVTHEFFESLNFDTPLLPSFSEIWTHQSAGVPTGYSWDAFVPNPEGEMLTFSQYAEFPATAAPGDIQSTYMASVASHSPEGIDSGSYMYRGVDPSEELDQELEFTRKDKKNYTYEGAINNQPVHGQFQAKGGVWDYYETLLWLQRNRERTDRIENTHVRFVGFIPDAKAESKHSKYPYNNRTVERAAKAETMTLHFGGDNSVVEKLEGIYATSVQVKHGATELPLRIKLLERLGTVGQGPGRFTGAAPLLKTNAPFRLANLRQNFQTQYSSRASRTPAPKPPASLFRKVRYAAPLGSNAGYVSIHPNSGKRRPAIIWVSGGFDSSLGDWAWSAEPRSNDQTARAFREAGVVLMLPSFRGANDNPGRNECFLGEINDLLAAREFLARQPEVDPEHIYLGGHSTGGTVALLAAASTNKFRAVFAFGPADSVLGYGDDCMPEGASVEEVRLRSPLSFVAEIRTPTFVFEGTQNGNAYSLLKLQAKASRQVHFNLVAGFDHFSILAPATEVLAQAIVLDRVNVQALSPSAIQEQFETSRN